GSARSRRNSTMQSGTNRATARAVSFRPTMTRTARTDDLSSQVLRQDRLDGLRIVRSDRGVDPVPSVEDERKLLLGSVAIEFPPVHEVARAPEPPLPYSERRDVC